MKVKTVDRSKKDKLYYALYSYSHSLMRRGVTIIPFAHSGYFGSVDITVVGVRGIVRKTIVVSYDELNKIWVSVSDGKEYELTSLSEISNLLRSKIAKMSTVVSKI